jgi:hypothetical protein
MFKFRHPEEGIDICSDYFITRAFSSLSILIMVNVRVFLLLINYQHHSHLKNGTNTPSKKTSENNFRHMFYLKSFRARNLHTLSSETSAF